MAIVRDITTNGVSYEIPGEQTRESSANVAQDRAFHDRPIAGEPAYNEVMQANARWGFHGRYVFTIYIAGGRWAVETD